MKILNTIKNFNSDADSILKTIGETTYKEVDQDWLTSEISSYEVLLVGLNLKVDKSVIDNGASLKIIATPATGLDHIDVAYAKERGIKVVSLKGEDEFLKSITGTSELAFGLMIALVRKIPWAFDDVKKGDWDREKFIGNSLSGKTLGIVGLGRLGSAMSDFAEAFRMKVVAYDPDKNKTDLEALLAQSDIISIHVPLNEDTEGMIGKLELSKMKSGAYLINTSRGQIINEDDLIKALDNKKIAGYATDVLSNELNQGAESLLKKYAQENDNVLITPHIGGMTRESRAATDLFIAQKVVEAIS